MPPFIRNLRKLGGHNLVQFKVGRESVHKRQDYIAIEQKPFALAGVRHIGELMGTDIQLLGKNLSIAAGLV